MLPIRLLGCSSVWQRTPSRTPTKERILIEARSLLQRVSFEDAGKDDEGCRALREAHQLLKRVSFAADVKDGSPWLKRTCASCTGIP